MAAAPRAAQWLTAADGTRHALIEVSSDSSDDEVAVGGLGDVLAPLDPAAAQAGDASEDDEGEEELVVAGALNYKIVLYVCDQHQQCRFSRQVWLKRACRTCMRDCHVWAVCGLSVHDSA